MLKDVGLVVNCGRWRLRRASKRDSVMISFVTAVESFEGDTSETIDELREVIQEAVSSWSRAGWRKIKQQERERKLSRQ
jgi:hypothetical protein